MTEFDRRIDRLHDSIVKLNVVIGEALIKQIAGLTANLLALAETLARIERARVATQRALLITLMIMLALIILYQ